MYPVHYARHHWEFLGAGKKKEKAKRDERNFKGDVSNNYNAEEAKKERIPFSNCTFRSCDLRVMSPARFHCAKLLFFGDMAPCYES
ncbi:hypothetical protein M431DRAFT_310619 [Trichoderma harzianum CBS 226.95]|uniref:Uncharacterized protein n=1 Tax=Trichoderma harzianum CBS 226.95 TaxID=983964 RepID=A0A2T4ARG6_TRIHA|nr:hypothetical protein M431DRAFT_310619 [Trichoderma harzianum CBS 226.95]PTB59652.1 hypothetical protein M431DRAFT_310619 [Trichoderma harzianum CBS 226.95]